MGKLYRHLWHEITSFANLLLAFRKAARGKRSRAGAASFEFKLEENLVTLRWELLDGTYQPSGYTSFVVHDPKRRLISAAPFRDRVVHHALMNVTAPLFERSFIDDSFANRVGKGTHRALDRCTTYLRRYRYLLPLDVRQFFPSIDHAILVANLERTLGDAKTLALCRQILASGAGVLNEEYDMVYFGGDDLFAANRPRGLPIGNLTSQFWANVYLNPFDHFVKRQLRVPGYIRYVDDMLLFGDSKVELQAVRQAAIEYLAGLRLTVHENSAQVRPSATGIPFLGFQLFPDHRRLKRRKGVQAVRRFRGLVRQHRAGQLSQTRIKASVIGWINHVRYGDTWGLRRAILDQVVL
jgi:RNA-directed DNA polymerase